MNTITNITVNTPTGEHEYKMNRPDWEIHSAMFEVKKHHPEYTSLVVVLVRK